RYLDPVEATLIRRRSARVAPVSIELGRVALSLDEDHAITARGISLVDGEAVPHRASCRPELLQLIREIDEANVLEELHIPVLLVLVPQERRPPADPRLQRPQRFELAKNHPVQL